MYRSKSQAAAFHAKASRGEIPQSVVDEFDRASKGKMSGLPEHVKKAYGGPASESRRLSSIYHTHIDENGGGNVPNVPCKRCGYADGGEVHETMQETLARHERERQAASDNQYEENTERLHADRPRVSVSDDEKQPKARDSDTAMASNYASGGDVRDDDDGDTRYITYDQVNDGERVNRRRDGSDREGHDVPYEYDEERKEKDQFQRVFNNERRGHIAPVHNFAKGGMATTAMSFASHLAQKARMKGSPMASRFKAGR